MAKTITIPAKDPDDGSTCYEGTLIQLGDYSITIRAATAKTVYELVYQLQEWETKCQEEADRLRSLCTALGQVQDEAVHKNWFDAADGERLMDMLGTLDSMWGVACREMEQKRDAYGDAWTHLATLLDRQGTS